MFTASMNDNINFLNNLKEYNNSKNDSSENKKGDTAQKLKEELRIEEIKQEVL